MQVGFPDSALTSSRTSGGHAKPPSNLPVSPSKAKPTALSVSKLSAPAQLPSIGTADLRVPKSSCVDSLKASALSASPVRTPMANISNARHACFRKLQVPSLAVSSLSTLSTESGAVCCPGSSVLAPCTPEASFMPAAASTDSATCAAHPIAKSQVPTLVTPSKTQASNFTPVAKDSKSPSHCSQSCSTPPTPEIVEDSLRRAHISDEASSSDAESEDPDLAEGAVRAGEIHLFVGPMFAGKSTSLLNHVRQDIRNGRSVATVKSHKDDRYANNFVVTHTGDREACYAVPTLRAFKEQVPYAYRECDVIAIDEGQFFSDLFEFCIHAADKDGKIIYIAGLDGDFQRQKFGRVLDLIPYADTVTKLHSNCAFCSRKGVFSLRISADTRQEVVGGADQYRPVCRHHYLQLSSTRSCNVAEE